jgi:hypothetical protein
MPLKPDYILASMNTVRFVPAPLCTASADSDNSALGMDLREVELPYELGYSVYSSFHECNTATCEVMGIDAGASPIIDLASHSSCRHGSSRKRGYAFAERAC